MGALADITELRKALRYQTRLHELETRFAAGTGSRHRIREDLQADWPQIKSAQAWCAERAATDIRAAIMCGKLAGVAGRLMDSVTGRETLIRWRSDAVAGLERALQRSDLPDELARDVVHDLLGHLTYLAFLHSANQNRDAARQSLERAQELSDLPAGRFAEPAIYSQLGMIALREEQWDEAEAHLLRALAAAEREGGDEGRKAAASTNSTLGVMYSRRSNHDEAVEHHRAASDLYEQLRDQSGACTTLINLASTLRSLGRRAEAESALDRAGALVTELEPSGPTALYKANRGLFQVSDPDPERRSEGVKMLEEARAEFARIGDRAQEEQAGSALGQVYRSVLNVADAPPTYAQRSHAFRRLAALAQDRRDYAPAMRYMEHLWMEAEQGDNKADQLEALAQLGHMHAKVGDHERAIDYHECARRLLEAIRQTEGATVYLQAEREILLSSGQALRHLGRPDEAATRYERALAIAKTQGDEDGERRAQGNLALVNIDRGRFDAALPALRDLADQLRQSDNYQLYGLARFNLAYGLYRAGELRAAHREAEEALRLLDLINSPEAEEIQRQVAEWPPITGGGP